MPTPQSLTGLVRSRHSFCSLSPLTIPGFHCHRRLVRRGEEEHLVRHSVDLRPRRMRLHGMTGTAMAAVYRESVEGRCEGKVYRPHLLNMRHMRRGLGFSITMLWIWVGSGFCCMQTFHLNFLFLWRRRVLRWNVITRALISTFLAFPRGHA